MTTFVVLLIMTVWSSESEVMNGITVISYNISVSLSSIHRQQISQVYT